MVFLGEIRAFAFDWLIEGWEKCEGQTLTAEAVRKEQSAAIHGQWWEGQTSPYPSWNLLCLLGSRYGGDGRTTVGLPDLREAGERDQVDYFIATHGDLPNATDSTNPNGSSWDEDLLTHRLRCAFDVAPLMWHKCNGQLLDAQQYPALASLLGDRYGGDGKTQIGLPDLSELSERDGVNDCLCTWGMYTGNLSQPKKVVLGQIDAFAVDFAPTGWAECNGASIMIDTHLTLYSVLGTKYGGNGTTHFQLPDMRQASERDRMVYCIAMEGVFPKRSY